MANKILKKFLSEEVINYFDDQIESVEQSVLEEKARAEAQEAAIRGEFAAADAVVLSESKAYTDAEVLEEKTRALAAESLLQSEIDAEEALRASEDIRILSESKTYTDAKVLTEKGRAESAEAGLQTEIDSLESYVENTFIKLSTKGQPNGVAELNESGLIPASQLPSYVDDVLEFAGYPENFPTPGEGGKIYVDTLTSKTYRWAGSVYVQITSGAVDSVFGRLGVVTAQSGDYSAEQVSYGMGSTVKAKLDSLQSEIDAEEVRAMAEEDLLDGKIEAEKTRAMAEEALLDGKITTEKNRAMAAELALDVEIEAEKVRAMAAEADLAADILLGDQTEALNRATAIALALEEAKEYTDEQVAEIQSDLDSLELLVQELRSDVDDHELRIGYVEAKHVPVPKQKFFLIDETSELSFLDLGELAMDQSLVVFYNINVIRPVHHFTVSVVNGQTRLTWVNSLVPGQDMGVEVNDEFFVSYMV